MSFFFSIYIFLIFIEFVAIILLLFIFWFSGSPIMTQTCTPTLEGEVLNTGSPEVPINFMLGEIVPQNDINIYLHLILIFFSFYVFFPHIYLFNSFGILWGA